MEEKWYNDKLLGYKAEPYRNSLIHEMLHAAFSIYACRCEYGCGEKLIESHARFGGQ